MGFQDFLSGGGSSILSAGVSGLFGLAGSALNNMLAGQQTDWDRRKNFEYNEMSAEAADKRTRQLYNDYYSPSALLKQYKDAGLSPSLMFGGTPGQGGMAGARGNGAAGMATPYAPVSMLEAAQVANILAQTNKTKAETKNIEVETERDKIQKGIEELASTKYKQEWELLTTPMMNEDGTDTSMFELAKNSESYEAFEKKIRTAAEKSGRSDLKMYTTTENGQQQLRKLYLDTQRFDWNISVLGSEKISAEFQQQIIEAMQKTDFTKLNAEAAVKYLEANIETAKLTETQKEAWNNLIERMKKEKGDTAKDILIVLGMIFNQAMTSWSMPNVNFNHTEKTNVII